jgi:cell division protein FtsL
VIPSRHLRNGERATTRPSSAIPEHRRASMSKRPKVLTVMFALAIVGLAAAATMISIAPPAYGYVCECANDDSPVKCKGGVIYPNMCVAHCFHASGCKRI